VSSGLYCMWISLLSHYNHDDRARRDFDSEAVESLKFPKLRQRTPSLALQRIVNVALIPANDADHMFARIFAGENEWAEPALRFTAGATRS
jgi:hypothetical protein